MKTSSLAFAAVLGANVTGAHATPEENSKSDIWALLSDIQIEEIVTETSYIVNKSWPEELDKPLRDVEITGYAVPMLPGESIKELILTSDSGLCPLCGALDHVASLQVTLDKPIPYFEEGQRITLKGTLRRVEDNETWQAAHLTGAQIIKH